MTQQETRQLGIEFERRIQTMYPLFQVKEKLNTDTIYSFLSEYQKLYVQQMLLALDQTESNSIVSNKIADTLKTLTVSKTLDPQENVIGEPNSKLFSIPPDYLYYLRSNSIVSKNYKFRPTLKSTHISNRTIKETDIAKILSSDYNQAIIRHPFVVLETGGENPYVKVVHDSYTTIDGLQLFYIRQPYRFNVQNYDNAEESSSIHNCCELPFSCFEELIQGAVELFILKYKFALQLGSSKQQKQEGE